MNMNANGLAGLVRGRRKGKGQRPAGAPEYRRPSEEAGHDYGEQRTMSEQHEHDSDEDEFDDFGHFGELRYSASAAGVAREFINRNGDAMSRFLRRR